jgi:hypothetical protein
MIYFNKITFDLFKFKTFIIKFSIFYRSFNLKITYHEQIISH